MTTMVWGIQQRGIQANARRRASLVHGGVMAALMVGALSLWTVLALMVALLAHPAQTMAILEHDGARGVPRLVRQGTTTVLSGLRDSVPGRGTR